MNKRFMLVYLSQKSISIGDCFSTMESLVLNYKSKDVKMDEKAFHDIMAFMVNANIGETFAPFGVTIVRLSDY